MKTNNNTSSFGSGFVSLLTILFIGLKFTHYIDWSWWWVLSPIWILGIVVMLATILSIFLKEKNSRRVVREMGDDFERSRRRVP